MTQSNEISRPREAVRINVIASHVPIHREANLERIADFGIDEQFLYAKIGVLTRAVKSREHDTSDLCVQAFAALTDQHALDPHAIQLCCVVTQNPDRNIPHTAAIVHHKLQLARTCMTFDISQGCSGYTCAIAIATGVMDQLGLDHALVFTCDPYSKVVDPRDKNTALIFGDAATVSYLSRTGPGYRMVGGDFGTAPGTSACLRIDDGVLKMDGTAVLMNAVREVPSSIHALLDRQRLKIDDIDLFLLHPGSRRVIELLRKELALDASRAPFEIADHGNTVSSSIPVMLARHIQARQHRRMLLSGFGVGFSWGTCLIESCQELSQATGDFP